MTLTKDLVHSDPPVHAPVHDDPQPVHNDPQPRALRPWPVLLLALPAFVAIWSGWVGLGEMTGFGPVHPLPGIADNFVINTAITLPIGMEVYASYALFVWLSGRIRSDRTRMYAKWSAIGSLALGAAGQIIYHLMEAAGITSAPWPVTVLVACLPVAVLGMGAALAHLVHADVHDDPQPVHSPDPVSIAEPVHTLSVRQVHTETHETATEVTATAAPVRDDPQPAHTADQWSAVAQRLCNADPSGRRDPSAVASILRLRHVDGLPHARIAERIQCSTSTVSRTLSAARALI